MTDTLEGWHFCGSDRRLGYGDDRLIVAGQTLTVDVEPELCVRGLHASERAIDALQYAGGPIVSRVCLSDGVVRGDDKAVARARRTLWLADADTTLRDFARWCALEVIDLWDAPDVVRQYLETGDPSKRAAAWDAARAAARAAAWAAARAAARAAAWDAARAAAWDAARAAAWDAAWDAARDAARAAARDKQNAKLEQMLMALKP